MMVSMDPAIHRGEMPLADRYRRFARREARGVSLVYETWAEAVADNDAVLSLLNTLPPGKQQPNLVFAAARLHGADSTYDSFRSTVSQRDRKSTRLNSSHVAISYAVFCLKKNH